MSAEIGLVVPQVSPFGSLRPSGCVPIIEPLSDRGFHRVEDELGESWLEHWLESGIRQLEAYLEKHAAFFDYLDTAEQS